MPVRHHSPACAWHVDRLIRDLQPDAVLIEGPRDATRLIPLLDASQDQDAGGDLYDLRPAEDRRRRARR